MNNLKKAHIERINSLIETLEKVESISTLRKDNATKEVVKGLTEIGLNLSSLLNTTPTFSRDERIATIIFYEMFAKFSEFYYEKTLYNRKN